jgi:hypothetical protein
MWDSSEMLVVIYQTTLRHIPEEGNLIYIQSREKAKSNNADDWYSESEERER